MGCDLNMYRSRVGLYYARSTRLPHMIDLDTVLLINLFSIIGLGALPVMLLYLQVKNISYEYETKTTRYLQVRNISYEYGIKTTRYDIYSYLKYIFLCIICISVVSLITYIITYNMNYLIYRCGDICKNPGPSSLSSSSLSSLVDSYVDLFSNIRYKDLVKFSCLNVQSLLPKLPIVEAEFGDRDIILLTETWLKDEIHDNDLKLINFKTPYRKDRGGERMGGGVLIYVRDIIPSKRRQDLEVVNIECLWVELTINKKKILFGVFYRPPDSGAEAWDLISQSIENAINTGIDKIIITGDLNENLLNERNNKLNTILQQNGLSQAITDPTFFCELSSSLLDIISTNDPESLLYTEVGENILEANIRYHCPVSGILNISKPPNKFFSRKIWNYNNGNVDQYRTDLEVVDWDTILSKNDINDIVSEITETILNVAEKNIPRKTVKIRSQDPPWMTSNIKKLIRRRKRFHKKAKIKDTTESWERFRKARNECVNTIKLAKATLLKKQTENLEKPDISVRNWWKILSNLSGRPPKCSNYPPLFIHDNYIEDDQEKANVFNMFFCQQASIDDSNATLPHFPFPADVPTLNTILITEEEVFDHISSLDISKATGPDEISARLIKYAGRELCRPLAQLFNKSIKTSTFPSSWKTANVIPVFKNGDRELLGNYRPIALLSIIGKIMEKCVFKHLFNFLNQNRLITSLQSGFIPGDSTVNQLLHLSDTFGKALDAGKEVRVIFCDISKAFDRVWHEGLIYKLNRIGIRGKLLRWFMSYLSNRKQRVVISGQSSEVHKIKAGVPQGSILGPLLFITFINDIVCDISCHIRLFADDTSLFIIVEDPYTAAELLNNDVEKIHQWSNQWLVNFNPKKNGGNDNISKNTKTTPPTHLYE